MKGMSLCPHKIGSKRDFQRIYLSSSSLIWIRFEILEMTREVVGEDSTLDEECDVADIVEIEIWR